jgi:hypothetical protein
MLGVVGCTHRAGSPFNYDAEGRPYTYQRREYNIERDWVHHVLSDVYKPPRRRFASRLTADQQPIVDQLGRPDWVRRPFRSFQNEKVQEWVYLDFAKVYQFIGGQLIFEGPLTDYEQILLRRGYPDHAISNRSDSGRVVDVLVYAGTFSANMQEYMMVDGMITQLQEGK